MTDMYLLVDYHGRFGTRRYSSPYRGGMDRALLVESFAERGYEVECLRLSDIDLRTMNFEGKYVLYTSAEDHGLLYKGYIEDVCYAMLMQGAILIPEYKFLRAHHNKVFMELLRDLSGLDVIRNIKARHFGTLEGLQQHASGFTGDHVLKASIGAGSKRVVLARGQRDICKKAARLSRTPAYSHEIWDFGRSLIHRGYARESRHRQKFIVQDFVAGLPNDWKVLVFGDRYYALRRNTRPHDFRASGSGRFDFVEAVPRAVLDFAQAVFEDFAVPHLSIDIGFDGTVCYLIEFQAVYFGTTTIEKSKFHFIKEAGQWVIHRGPSSVEREYVNSVDGYIKKINAGVLGTHS